MIRLHLTARLLGLSAFLGLLGALPAYSQTDSTWNGGTGNWSNTLNWSNGVPNGNFNAFIGNGTAPNPIAVLDINATTNEVSLNSAGVLIAPGNSLTTDTLLLSGTNSFVTGATGIETLNAFNISGNGTISNVGIGQTHITATGGTLTIATSSLGLGTTDSANFSITVDNGSALNITGGPFHNLNSGSSILAINLQGALTFDNAVVDHVGALSSLILDGPNAQILNKSGTNPFAGGLLVGSQASAGNSAAFEMRNGATLTTGDFNFFSFGPFDAGASISNGSKLTTGNFADGKDFSVDASSLTVNGNAVIGNWSENAGLDITNGSVLNVKGDLVNSRSFGQGALNTSLVVDGASSAVIGKDLTMGNNANADLAPRTLISNGSILSVGGNVNMTGYGQLYITDGSTLTVQKDLNIQPNSDPNNSASGVVAASGGSAVTVSGTVYNNGGSVQIDNSSVLTAKSGFTQTDGSTKVDGLVNVSGTGMQIQDGSLSGTGVINGNLVMGGMLMPGDPTGSLTITGNYTQTHAGMLVEEVGWLSGFSNNPLFVLGNAKLDGTLDIKFMTDYFPEFGDSFILMLFNSSTGKFSNLQGLDLGGGIGFEVEYEQHDVRLVAEEVSEPGVPLLFATGLIAIAAGLAKNYRRHAACGS
jgi:hypothetical protein